MLLSVLKNILFSIRKLCQSRDYLQGSFLRKRTCWYRTNYLVLLIPAQGESFFSDQALLRLEATLREIAVEKSLELNSFTVRGPAISLMVSVPVQTSVTTAIKYLKGISARRLLNDEALNLEAPVWTSRSMVMSLGEIDEKEIELFIKGEASVQSQKIPDN